MQMPSLMVEARHDGHFGERLIRLRHAQILSQKEIASRVGVNVRTYRTWEAGDAVPWVGKNLRRLCAVLRVRADYLLWGEGEEDK